MDKSKKFTILLIVDIVLIVVMGILMKSNTEGYKTQAKSSSEDAVAAYGDAANAILYGQWKSVDQYGMAWKLAYMTLTGNKTEAAFDAAVKAIEADSAARLNQVSYIYAAAGIPEKGVENMVNKAGLADKFLLKNEKGEKQVACGEGCTMTYAFAKGKLVLPEDGSFLNPLKQYKLEGQFKLAEPAPFNFDKE